MAAADLAFAFFGVEEAFAGEVFEGVDLALAVIEAGVESAVALGQASRLAATGELGKLGDDMRLDFF